MKFIALFTLEFLAGSLMFSYWIGKIMGVDIRKAGDGNPGAFNLFKKGGLLAGSIGMFLDYLKGFLPLYLLIQSGYLSGLDELQFGLVAVAPLLGHAFTPFLGFQGGKGIAVSFGIWSALTLWKVPLLMGAVLTPLYFAGKGKEWLKFTFFAGLAAASIFLLATNSPASSWLVLVVNTLVYAVKIM